MKSSLDLSVDQAHGVFDLSGNKGSLAHLSAGSHTKITAKAGEKYKLKKAASESVSDDVIAIKEGNTLNLKYADGTQLSLEGFYAAENSSLELSIGENAAHTISSADVGGNSTLVYSHGNSATLMNMAAGNESLMNAIASNSLVSNLPHYAEAAAAAATDAAVSAGAATTAAAGTAAASTGLSTMAMVGMGALAVGGVAVASNNSDNGSSNSSSPTTPTTPTPPPPPPTDTTAPIFTSDTFAIPVAENSGAGQVVYTAVATDTGVVTYSLNNMIGDSSLFSINAVTGEVTLIGDPDFEAKSSYSFSVVATDSAGNASGRAVGLNITDINEFTDTTAPVFTSGATAAAIIENSGENKVVYTAVATDTASVTYSLKNTGDGALFTIDSTSGEVTLIANPDFETKPNYNFTVLATDAANNVTEQAVTLGITNDVADDQAVSEPILAVIDLGTYGQLYKPYQIDSDGDGINDKIYYYWDRNKDGINGSEDNATQEQLAAIFQYDASGNLDTNTSTSLDETYRYATLNGIQVALPVAGRPVDQYLLDNQAYDGLAEVWDTYNSGYQTPALYGAWSPDFYWSATPGATGKHGKVFMGNGQLLFDWDTNSAAVALEVFNAPLDLTKPLFTSGASISVTENSGTAAYDATADGDTGIKYTLSGTDALDFNINSTTGLITFNTTPDFEIPSDSNADNIYDIVVSASELGGNFTDQSVQITVTNDTLDDNVTPPAAVIDLGSYFGQLISPTQVDGKTYYFWDYNKSGAADTGDMVSFAYINLHFTVSETGVDEVFSNKVGTVDVVDDTYRFGTINGVAVAMPKLGASYAAYLADDQTYSDYAEIWDTHNSGFNTAGIPDGWASGTYWTASDGGSSHATLTLNGGGVTYQGDTNSYYVAMQVL